MRRWPLLRAALAAGVLIVGTGPPGGGAETAPALRAEAGALSRSESTALLQLYAAESSLARAQTDLSRLNARSEQLAHAEQSARRRTEIVRRSLRASQERVAALLRELYVQGEPDPIAVVLGATSLEEAMAGIEGLSRAAAQSEQLGLEAEERARRLERLRARLAERRASLTGARSAARAGAERLTAAVAGSRQTLAAIRDRRSLTVRRLEALEERARAAERRSAEITAQAVEDAAPPAQPLADEPVATLPKGTQVEVDAAAATQPPVPAGPAGTRSLVVDAVAYHLPGTTASGLPVGVGVIAVDPTVIPLGTRLNIPGYGLAVAADVGSAIKGNIIDLWMPSTARARAWGRRTVTITVYG